MKLMMDMIVPGSAYRPWRLLHPGASDTPRSKRRLVLSRVSRCANGSCERTVGLVSIWRHDLSRFMLPYGEGWRDELRPNQHMVGMRLFVCANDLSLLVLL